MYHIAQASQVTHGALVDRGANGGLAGSDMRILSRSSRRCTVTAIDIMMNYKALMLCNVLPL